MKVIIAIDEDTNVTYKVTFVASFNTDDYYFQVNNEERLREYLIEYCSIYKNELKNINYNKSNIFKHMENNKRYTFSFGHGRYYYIKSNFEKC